MWRGVLGEPDDTASAVFLAGETGFVACGTQRTPSLRAAGYAGEVGALYMLQAAHGRGAGRALMLAAFRHLAACGHRGAALWVLATNAPARRFYERLGGIDAGMREDVIHGHAMDDVAYGWPDLADTLRTLDAPARSRRGERTGDGDVGAG